MMEMNMAPLIDVMRVLIIMLVIRIPRQNHSVNLSMPVGNPPPATQEPVVITFDIDFDGKTMWDNVEIPDGAALVVRLAGASSPSSRK
jgi:biopolymer transport protein ExbD